MHVRKLKSLNRYNHLFGHKTALIFLGATKIAINKKKANDDFGILSIQSFEANSTLIRHLVGKYVIEYVIGHSEYGKF